MNREDIIRIAREAGAVFPADGSYHRFESEENLERFAALVAFAEREACADIADRLPRTYRETKEAHERATLEPFHPSRFGFDFAETRQAEVITHAIRARGNVATNDTSQERVDETTKQRHDNPPQRTWVGLTLEEILETYRGPDGSDYVDYARGIEAKLKEKNT